MTFCKYVVIKVKKLPWSPDNWEILILILRFQFIWINLYKISLVKKGTISDYFLYIFFFYEFELVYKFQFCIPCLKNSITKLMIVNIRHFTMKFNEDIYKQVWTCLLNFSSNLLWKKKPWKENVSMTIIRKSRETIANHIFTKFLKLKEYFIHLALFIFQVRLLIANTKCLCLQIMPGNNKFLAQLLKTNIPWANLCGEISRVY